MALTAEQREFYTALEDTFRTPGWRLMIQGWITERDSLPEIMFANAKTMEEVGEARVRYALLNELIQLSAFHEAQREQLENGTEDDMYNV
jgi:hypothetical protein